MTTTALACLALKERIAHIVSLLKSSLKKDWDFRINSEQRMVIVFEVHRPTTSLARFENGVLHKLQIQVSLILLKLNKRIPLYKEKGTLIDISAMVNFNLGKISFKTIFLVESSPCGIKLNAFNWCNRWIFNNYVSLVDIEIVYCHQSLPCPFFL